MQDRSRHPISRVEPTAASIQGTCLDNQQNKKEDIGFGGCGKNPAMVYGRVARQ
jgi:hypothetical protein